MVLLVSSVELPLMFLPEPALALPQREGDSFIEEIIYGAHQTAT